MTTVYLMRHSEPFKVHKGIEETNESILFLNIKTPLSVNGEHLAEKISLTEEFKNLDVVWSSNYVRAMSTAKYFANENNLKVNISDKLGERIHGVNTWDELPENFEIKQYEDFNYKLSNGECLNEVKKRMYDKLINIIKDNKDKRILIVSHATALMMLFTKWCDIDLDSVYKFNDKVFFEGNWDFCESFKLEFNDELELISIKNIKR